MGRPPTCTCGTCAKCKHAAYMREWWQRKTLEERRAIIARRDRKRVQSADRERASKPERKEQAAKALKQWRQADPRRKRCHSAVERALKAGTLEKGPCERLGDDCRGPIHAHHDDYDRPLDVRWFCAHHHHEARTD